MALQVPASLGTEEICVDFGPHRIPLTVLTEFPNFPLYAGLKMLFGPYMALQLFFRFCNPFSYPSCARVPKTHFAAPYFFPCCYLPFSGAVTTAELHPARSGQDCAGTQKHKAATRGSGRPVEAQVEVTGPSTVKGLATSLAVCQLSMEAATTDLEQIRWTPLTNYD